MINFGKFPQEKYHLIITESLEHGDLLEYVIYNDGLPENIVKFIFSQLIKSKKNGKGFYEVNSNILRM